MPGTSTYTHIESDPSVCGGLPRIAGTRIRVMDIVDLHQQGLTPVEMLDSYEHLTLGQIHAALAYYYDHRQEVEQQIEDHQRRAEDFRRTHPQLIWPGDSANPLHG